MTTPRDLPAGFYDNKVAPRFCGQQPGGDSDELPRHPRPAGVNLNLMGPYAADYGVETPHGEPLREMNLRPILDALAAAWDQCDACLAHHSAAVAADPPLTVHLVGAALSALNIGEASARLLIQKLDPDGCALALTIRTRGPEAASGLAGWMGEERRRKAVDAAVQVLAPTGWLDAPVSNLTPPVPHRSAGLPGDAEMFKVLRGDGYLP